MKVTGTFGLISVAAYVAKVIHFLGEYAGPLAGAAACVSIISGIVGWFRKPKA